MKGTVFITGSPDADALLNRDATALVVGMLLDQQVPMEWAFTGPHTLRSRLGHLDAARIAAMPVDDFVAVCCAKPAIHRFPAVMARRIHELCGVVAASYRGRTERIWSTTATAAELYSRLRALPGFGDEKAKILIALLAKRYAVAPDGWRTAAGPFADDVPRSVADCSSPESLAVVRDWKKAQRAAHKDKQDRPLREIRS